MIEAGTTEAGVIIGEMKKVLGRVPLIEIEYISIVDPETLQSIDTVAGKVLAAVAVNLGTARLIDNILVDVRQE